MSQANDFRQAQILVSSLPRGVLVPEVDRVRFPITSAMASYVLDFESAKQKHGLHEFDVQRRLDTIRRLPAEIFRPLRSIAGLLILSGLLTTLFMLSRTVAPLGEAFKDLSNQQATSNGLATDLAQDQISSIQRTMSDMAGGAKLAFRLSFTFIFGATLIMLSVATRQPRRTKLISRFANWAEKSYREALPEQVSIGEAAAAFRQNADALGSLTQSFNDLSISLEAVKGFSTTMEDVREAIVKSLDRIPGVIQASMGLVSKDMVKNLERAMRDDVEATKKILAIYGQQEFRIDEIAKHVSAVKELTEKTTGAVATLEAIPQHLNAIDTSLKQHTSVAGQIEATTRRIEEAVIAFPSEELKSSATALIEATDRVGRAHSQAVGAIIDLQSKASILANADIEVGKDLEKITAASQQFLDAYDKLMTSFDNSQLRVAEGLEWVATQIQREIRKLAEDKGTKSIPAQLQTLQLVFDDFRNELRLLRTTSLPGASVEPNSGADGKNGDGASLVKPNVPVTAGNTLGTAISDRVFTPLPELARGRLEDRSGVAMLEPDASGTLNSSEDETYSRDHMTHAEEL